MSSREFCNVKGSKPTNVFDNFQGQLHRSTSFNQRFDAFIRRLLCATSRKANHTMKRNTMHLPTGLNSPAALINRPLISTWKIGKTANKNFIANFVSSAVCVLNMNTTTLFGSSVAARNIASYRVPWSSPIHVDKNISVIEKVTII